MSTILRHQVFKQQQIIDTLKQCGLQDKDFEVIQKMSHDGSYIPTPTKTVFDVIGINVLNREAVLDHAEEIGKVYRVNILTLENTPLYVSIEHDNGIGVHRQALSGGGAL